MLYGSYSSPVGELLLVSDGDSLTGLYMDQQLPETGVGDCPVLEKAKAWLDAYFQGEDPQVSVPLTPRGTPFQEQIWKYLQAIPYGKTCTYGEIAREIGCGSAQAVGQAVGSNPIAIIIPCHRVVGVKERLTGYAWGIEKKKWLLEHEICIEEETE